MKIQKISSIATLLLFFFISVCFAKNSAVEISCKAAAITKSPITQLVLLGTEVVKIENFQIAQHQLPQHYAADIGGAILTASLIPSLIPSLLPSILPSITPSLTTEPTSIHLKRTYQAPGEPLHKRSYQNLCISNNALHAQNLIVKTVIGGILILETKPGVEGMPDDLWVFYKKVTI